MNCKSKTEFEETEFGGSEPGILRKERVISERKRGRGAGVKIK
jgi:hypothetical protein